MNLATHMLVDGFKGDHDVAIVVSNDSDLREPIEAVRGELRLAAGIFIPGANTWSALAGDFYRRIRVGALAASQLPLGLRDAHGTIRKPAGW